MFSVGQAWTKTRLIGFGGGTAITLALVWCLMKTLNLTLAPGVEYVAITNDNYQKLVGRPPFINLLDWELKYDLQPGDHRPPTTDFQGANTSEEILQRIDQRWTELKKESAADMAPELWGYETSPFDHTGWCFICGMALLVAPACLWGLTKHFSACIRKSLASRLHTVNECGASPSQEPAGQRKASTGKRGWTAWVWRFAPIGLWLAAAVVCAGKLASVIDDCRSPHAENLPTETATEATPAEIEYHTAMVDFECERELTRSRLAYSSMITSCRLEAEQRAERAQQAQKEAERFRGEAARLEANSSVENLPDQTWRDRSSPSEWSDLGNRLQGASSNADAARRAAEWARATAANREYLSGRCQSDVKALTDRANQYQQAIGNIDQKLAELRTRSKKR